LIENKVVGISIKAQCSEIHDAGLLKINTPAADRMKAGKDVIGVVDQDNHAMMKDFEKNPQ